MVRKATLVGATLVALLAGSLVSTGLLAPAASASEAGQVTPRVVGGTVAANGSWPSQAYVEIEVEPGVFSFCGGTLIEPNWILTAAHCVVRGGDAVPASSVLTAIGKNDLRAIEGSDVLGIRSISVHPDYLSLRSGDRWDFALLELERASTQPTTALIAPGQESSTLGGQPGSIAGWGCTSQVPPGGSCPASPPLPADLIEAQVSFVSDSECESPFPTSYGGGFDREIMVCAGNFETGLPDTCFGDSGGPLIAFGPGGERLLAGITSFGYGCATPSFPGVYAKVLAGRDWILRTIGAEFGLEVTTGGTGQGTVTSNPAGIACGPTCSADFPYGTEVTLTAKADSGSGFTGWNGACSGTESCTVTIGAATQVGAEFRKAPTVSLKAKPAKRTSSRTAKFRFKSSQSGATFQCRIDGKSWSKCKSPRTYRNLKRGRKHTFRVKARKDGITGPVRQYVWFVRK